MQPQLYSILLLFSLQVFQVRKVQGAQTGRIFAMKVLKKVRGRILDAVSPSSHCTLFIFLVCLCRHYIKPPFHSLSPAGKDSVQR